MLLLFDIIGSLGILDKSRALVRYYIMMEVTHFGSLLVFDISKALVHSICSVHTSP